MTGPPRLSERDVSARLEKHYRQPHSRHLFAFYGSGADSMIDVSGAGRFAIVPVESELDLRDKLASYEAPDARVVFLVPWSTEVPLDVSGRFAGNGKVLRVGVEARLRRMFGVAEVSDEACRAPLARYLLATDPDASFRSVEGRLTERALWSAWLRDRWGLEALALDALLGFAARDGRGGAFVAAMQPAPEVREGLLALFDRELGPAGRAIWTAWERGRGEVALGYAVLCEELAKTSDPSAAVWLRLKLKQELDAADAQAVATALAGAALGALAHVSRHAPAHERAKLLAAADALVDEEAARAALRAHPRLPSAWRARLDAVGRALLEGAAAPSREALERASEALSALESHELYPESAQTTRVKRAAMAVRLLAFLVARTDRRTEGQATPHGDAVALGAWYAAEGGYLDWARGFARGSAQDELGRGVSAVVAAADEVRAELDARFATGLSAWIEAGRPSSEVVPIDAALARVAAPFLKGDPDRRLLVLLLDGMAWAQAVELLLSMGERAMAWGPLAWHASAEGRIGSAPVPPVFAALPTITEVSRAAFFGGKPILAGAATSTQKDPERFEAHRALRELCEAPPRLLLRAEGHTAGGAASQEALTLVGDVRRRVVGIVVNAIDASLKADPQQHARWDVDSIRPLADLLEAAQQAGRAILFASDHGHVPVREGMLRVESASSGGARWRGEEGALAETELRFCGEGVWTPRGKDAVVLLAGDAHRYSSAPHAGEHGGASLAEVVAPCLLIGSATERSEDAGQRVVGPFVPDWWLLRVRPAAPAIGPPPQRRGKPRPADNQLTLPAVAPPPPALVERPAELPEHPLARSKLFASLAPKKSDQEPILRAVEFLLAKNGSASAEAFAAAMGELAWRVPGLVSKLQGVLNVDGYQVLWFDPKGKQVHLDRAKLEQQFEVER